jgi:hypothetical protein
MLARENDDDRMGMNLSMPAMNKQEAYLCVKCGKQLTYNLNLEVALKIVTTF